MSKRHNEAFLNIFLELDHICCEKFGVTTGGVTEYISRLNNARFAPGRDEVLPKLVRYRNLRNRFVHEPGAIRKTDEITKADLKSLSRFCRDVKKKKDPISKYLRKAKLYALRKKLRKLLIAAVGVAFVVLVGVIIYLLST